jgi:cell wall-associated NlpC family hydrolase
VFFDSNEKFAALISELQSWKGTKFVDGMAAKGVGVDCVRFAERVLFNIGAISPVNFPPYVIRGGGPEMLSRLFDHTRRVPELEELWNRQQGPHRPHIRRGDLLICSSGKALHHFVLVAEPPVLWHALNSVDEGNLFDPVIADHIVGIFRVK